MSHNTTDDIDQKHPGLRKILRMLTFVDLPIKRKFRLFALGTMFWFLSMAVVAVVAFSMIHYKYNQVSEQAIPYSKTSSQVLTHLQGLSRDTAIILEMESFSDARSIESSREHIKSIQSAINDLNFTLSESRPISGGGNIVENLLRSLARANSDTLHFLQQIMASVNAIDRSFDDFMHVKLQSIQYGDVGGSEVMGAHEELSSLIRDASTLTVDFSQRMATEHAQHNEAINTIIRLSIHTILIVLGMASLLLFMFTRWISVAFYKPISDIINQIDSLSTGDVDLAQKLVIRSQDEIGTLSREFNNLIETVYGMTIYKKVIEDDASLDEVYRRMGEIFRQDIGIENSMIYEINPHKKEMRAAYPPLVGDTRLFCYEDILSDCTLCRAFKTGKNVSSYEFRGICRQFLPDTGMEHVCVPMMLGGNTGGVVQFLFPASGERAQMDSTTAYRLFKAETYINQSLSVIETKRLMNTLLESAMVDTLTGLYNRRFLQEHSKQIISGVLRRKKQIGLLICDLDYFKQINDTYGHDIGDKMLKETAAVLRSTVRDSDVVIRFGGEEFLILLLDVEPGDAVQVAEKIRANIENMKINVPDAILQKTISIGVSEFPGDTDGFWQSIKYADVALYQAKDGGRNQVVRFSEEMWPKKDF
ncbi:diguanylate cyclase [Desulfurispira natronophila]|uniref:diguanylate cyclase n=1 Tax=Desulfurispira natronophila TaxID=682562 RepID=A0A7W8DG45_9BACT|nr:diguanylate cyclase [Desulfurispira natronophila]MBB5021047.1 diguanylate cyclase (GGDEF)-like protein [Desulfurispira natronophila]